MILRQAQQPCFDMLSNQVENENENEVETELMNKTSNLKTSLGFLKLT